MDRPLRAIEWKAPDADHYTDVTDAVESAVVSATPHPDDAVDPATVFLHLDDADPPVEVPIGVPRVPHLGDQNEAELSVKPAGHDALHLHF